MVNDAETVPYRVATVDSNESLERSCFGIRRTVYDVSACQGKPSTKTAEEAVTGTCDVRQG